MSESEKQTFKEENLSKDEFRQLIPHLECNQLFLIEIKCSEKWNYLFDAHYENDTLVKLSCAACSQNIKLEEFTKHIISRTHLSALEKVDNFYHPLYTSGEKSSPLNEKSGQNEGEKLRNIQQANAIVAEIELAKRKQTYKSDSNFTEVFVPLKDLMMVKFQRSEESKWKALIKLSGPLRKGASFKCMLCFGKTCRGIIPLNDHLRGSSHRQMQMKIHAIRAPNHKNIEKQCVFLGDIERKPPSEKKNVILENGLIGVEYVVKLESDSQAGKYLYACCLCDSEIMASAKMMQNHLISFNHRLVYCELHYSNTVENFKRLIVDCRAKNAQIMPIVLEKIALGIEQYHGYGTPHTTTESHFKKSRIEVGELVRGLPHACQEFGPSFSNVMTAQEIRDFKKSPAINQEQILNENFPVRFTVKNPLKHYLNMRHHVSRALKKVPEISFKDRHSKTSSVQREKFAKKRSRSASREHVERKRQTLSKHKESAQTTDIWSVYRDLISKAAFELESLYESYRKNPEKHPLYDQEWNAFWRRRKEELVLEGKDYRAYNFQPEWTTYFRQRLEQIFGEDLQKSKLNVRHRLNIPIDAEEDSLPRAQTQNNSVFYGVTGTSTENMWNDNFGAHLTEKQWNFVLSPKKVDKPTVIHMLRLMTALEDHLGSLGSRILELLTKAVSLEKFYPSDSPELEKQILTSGNYKLLKAATEKLKSKLYADLIEGNKINSFKRVIDCAETILKKAEMMGWASEAEHTIDNENLQIKKLFEVLQVKKDSLPSMNKKSLSDALMDVISQKKFKETPDAFDLPNEQTLIRKQNSLANIIPSNLHSGVSNNTIYYSHHAGSDTINRNSATTRGRGNSIHFNRRYVNNSFGLANTQWPDVNERYDPRYQNQNCGSNFGFVNSQANKSNNGY